MVVVVVVGVREHVYTQNVQHVSLSQQTSQLQYKHTVHYRTILHVHVALWERWGGLYGSIRQAISNTLRQKHTVHV